MGEEDIYKMNFLDLTLVGSETSGTIQTQLYNKSTSENSILRVGCCHPQHVISAIPKGQCIVEASLVLLCWVFAPLIKKL